MSLIESIHRTAKQIELTSTPQINGKKVICTVIISYDNGDEIDHDLDPFTTDVASKVAAIGTPETNNLFDDQLSEVMIAIASAPVKAPPALLV